MVTGMGSFDERACFLNVSVSLIGFKSVDVYTDLLAAPGR